MPCGTFSSELKDKLGAGERDKMDSQKAKMEKQIAITNSISQNRRMLGVGRDLCGSSSPIPC